MTWSVHGRFEPNKPGIARVAVGSALKRAVRDVAELAKLYAVSNSPDGFGGYVGKFKVEQHIIPDWPGPRKEGEPMERVCATVINQSELAVLVEVGSDIVEEYGPLTRTLYWLERVGRG